MPNKELIERIIQRLKTGETADLLPPFSCLPEGHPAWLKFKAHGVIRIIAEAIENMKLPETLPEKPNSCYEFLIRRRHDINVQRNYGRAVRRAILDLLGGGEMRDELRCPNCGSSNVIDGITYMECLDCHNREDLIDYPTSECVNENRTTL